MTDLIDREALLNSIYSDNPTDIMLYIAEFPSATQSNDSNALDALERKKGKWILDENPHDGDCRCSACGIAIGQMHERNHGLLNALTNGKWWTFYNFCPNCGAEMREGEE